MDKKLALSIENIISEYKRLTHLECSFYPYTSESQFRFEISESNWFCKKIASNPSACKLCEKKRMKLLVGAMQTHEPIFSECHGGIAEFAVPCFSDRKLMGFFISYTVPSVEYAPNIFQNKEYFQEQFDISEQDLAKYLEEIPTLGRHWMRPSMLLLHSLVKMYIYSGFLPIINEGKLSGFEGESDDMESDLDRPPSFANIVNEGEKSENPFRSFELNSVQLTHKLYTYLSTGRKIQAMEQYERLFSPALQGEDIESVRFNTLAAFFKLSTFLIKEVPYFWSIFQLSLPIPGRIMTADSNERIKEVLDEYLEEVSACYGWDDVRNPIVARMVEYIETNYSSPITLEKLSRQMQISSAYASRLFKKYMGVNFKWYLNEVRMDATYNYLKRTQVPIHEIAERVGYDEVRSFYKMVKSHFGLTCSQIRELYKTQQTDDEDVEGLSF